mmetsp:Transcript_5451/g.8486  ORF Transcript_5451/g.8486 Transcript_5451/m.8486 type:complete len:227 (+) Transcript_5451:239-919(+)
MREFLLQLCKRRGQAKKPVVEMFDMCQNKLFDQLPNRSEKYKMLETLRDAGSGKMFLEVEYAAATMKLCKYLEEDGKAEEATNIIQEIQIETYGSLEVKDKVEFILYQMKLVLMKQDFVRCQILSRKISKRHLNQKGLEKLKLQFFNYMIRYYIHEKMILDVSKAYQTIFDTLHENPEGLEEEKAQKDSAFQNFVLYLLISPYEQTKVDLMKSVDKNYARSLEQNE